MLIPVLIVCAFITIVVAMTLKCALIVAYFSLQQQAGIHADIALGRAISDESAYYQQYIRVNGPAAVTRTPPPAPFEQTSFPACPDGSCRFLYTIRAHYTGSTGEVSGVNSAHALQRNYANEQKVSLGLQVQLRNGADGAVLMTRSRTLTFRVYDNAPYATLSGVHDIDSEVPGARTAAQGDVSGQVDEATARVNLSYGAPYNADGDTRIHLTARCQNVGQPYPGPPLGAPATFDVNTNAWEWLKYTNGKNRMPYNDGLEWGSDPHGAYELPCTSIDPINADGFDTTKTWSTGLDNPAGATQ